jgi:hypothetical protein
MLMCNASHTSNFVLATLRKLKETGENNFSDLFSMITVLTRQHAVTIKQVMNAFNLKCWWPGLYVTF